MIYLILALLMVTSCAKPSPIQELEEEYTTIQGFLASSPVFEDGDNRLVLFVRRNFAETVLVCIAVNDDNERLLKTIAEKITNETKSEVPLIIYGRKIDGVWEEYAQGVDLEIFAIGFYSVPAQRYQVILTNYGSRAGDAFRGISWGEFLKKVGAKGVDLVL